MPYTFDAIQAFDPTDPKIVAANADITIHMPSDPSKTPLPITDTTGVPLANPYRTNALGAMPSFQCETERVAWSGGGMTNFLTSWEGIRAAAAAAAVSAADAATGAARSAADAQAVADLLDVPAADMVRATIEGDIDSPTSGVSVRLDGKYAPKSHTHDIAGVTGLQDALAGKQAAGSYAPASHKHGANDLSGVVKKVNGSSPDVNGNVTVTGSGSGPSTIREVLAGENINAALAGFEGEVRLQRGVHNTAAPIVQGRRQKVVGEGGGATFVKATTAMARLWTIGDGAPSDRTHLSDLCLDANGLAQVGLDINIVGTLGNYNGEPDGQSHIERLYVDDAATTGVHVRGGDSQAYHLYGVRVRRAGDYGFRIDVGGPDAWIRDCEATTTKPGTGAGFLIGSSNLHFMGCKAWYTRGYGWVIKGTRNIFTDCEAQDTRLHGWSIDWDKNQFIGCMADSAGYADVGGVSNTQDGFYLAAGLKFTTMTGCAAFDREQGYPANMRYGFNMSASTYNIGRATSATAAAAGTGTIPVMIGPLSGGVPGEANYKTLGGLLNLR